MSQSVPQPVFSAGNEKFNFDATEEAFIPEDEGSKFYLFKFLCYSYNTVLCLNSIVRHK